MWALNFKQIFLIYYIILVSTSTFLRCKFVKCTAKSTLMQRIVNTNIFFGGNHLWNLFVTTSLQQLHMDLHRLRSKQFVFYINLLEKDDDRLYPSTFRVLSTQTYVDDILTGRNNIKCAYV